MSLDKRATIYFDPEIHRVLRVKAATLDVSISEVVNDAVKRLLAEDLDDLAVFEERAHEENLDFEDFVKVLQQRGKL